VEATDSSADEGAGPLGSAHRIARPTGRALRRWLHHLGAANQKTFEKVAEVFGHREWIADPRFATDTTRVAHREALAAAIEAVTATATRDTWLARLDEPAFRAGRSSTTRRRSTSRRRGRADGRGGRAPGARAHADDRHADQDVGDTARSTRRAPLLGEHTAAVLGALGYGEAAIARMSGAAPPL
jgi:crotonobetainyl-CoA:carnitine CoA-transferase CaiB-like acyl-CoA transferase